MNRPSLAAGLLCLCITGDVVADTLNLKDGTTVRGAVRRYEKGKFTVDAGGDTPRVIRMPDVESIDFEGGGAAPKPAAAAAAPAQPAAAAGALAGEELNAWKLARSHIAQNHENWIPDNATPTRNALQVTATGDYVVAIPVMTKPEQGFSPNYGIFTVQVTKFDTELRVDGDTFQETRGPFNAQQQRPRRGR